MTTVQRPAEEAPVGDLIAVLLRRRYVVLSVFAIVFWAFRLQDGATAGGDWSAFYKAAHHLGDVPAVGVYVGPLALLAALVLGWMSVTASWVVWSAVCMALGVYSIRCVEQTAAIAALGQSKTRERAVLIGGAFLLYVWSWPAVVNGHLDDVFALTAIAVALRGVASNRWLVVSVAIAFAFASKPWAVLVLPLAAAIPGKRVRGIALAVGLAMMPSIPFVIAHHGHLDVSHLNLGTYPDSTLTYFGVKAGSRPTWARELQVLVAWPLVAWAIWRGRWYLVPLLALAVRVNLDPQTSTYYVTGAFLGLLVWDVCSTRLPGARVTAACVALLILPSDLSQLGLAGPRLTDATVIIRALIAVIPIAALAVGEVRRRDRSGAVPADAPVSAPQARR